MFKVTFVVYHRSDVPHEKAVEYWKSTHADIVRKIPGLRRYVQSIAVASPAGELPFLGIAEIEFDDEAAFGAAAASAEFGAAVADVPNFADPDRLPTAFMVDNVVV